MSKKIFFAGLGALILLGFGSYLYVLSQLSAPKANAEIQEFEVLPGWGAKQVAQALEQEGFIRNARIFSAWLSFRDLDRGIGEGLYDLSASMQAIDIAQTLSLGGRPRTIILTFPEGFRAKDIAQRLAGNNLGSATEFLNLMSEPNDLRPAYIPPEAGLEGYLFPASYDIPLQESPKDIINLLLARFSQEITSENNEALKALALTVHDWVILASMVQAEAATPQEMPIIAGVFLNRLDLDMLLQSDPTVAYGLGKDLPELNVFAGDFKVDHPWNTYTQKGLPESPINNPGQEALWSVLNAERHNNQGQAYLYFLHGLEDNQAVFRPNISLEAHNRDVERYLR